MNRELIALYWNIGRMISERQNAEGWGAKVIDRLAADIKNELPENAGDEKVPQPVAQIGEKATSGAEKVPRVVARLAEASLDLPWGYNLLLIEKVKDLDRRLWYMLQSVQQGWSREVLGFQLESGAYERQGQAVTNFDRTLPSPQSDLAQQSLKDPYVFDFLTLAEPFRELELENALVRQLQDFLVELGVGFAFVGRQHRVEVGESDFCIDLLFYHLQLRCFVVIELKRGAFRPEYAGQLNFYLNVVDDTLRHVDDNPTIGLVLCQEQNRIVAEYALRGLDKAIGVSEYELTRTLPDSVKGSLPEIEELEEQLADIGLDDGDE